MDGGDEPLADTGWLARLLKLRAPPTPPPLSKTIYDEVPDDPLPDLFCNEVMPSTTSWPPVHKPWPFKAPSPPDGSTMPERSPLPVAAVSPLPSARSSPRVVGRPITVERVSHHARTNRLSELEKLSKRIEKLEASLREMGDRIDASSRKRPTQNVNQPGCGGTINMSGGAVEGGACFTFGEGSTMNAYLLDRLIDECWPDTTSEAP